MNLFDLFDDDGLSVYAKTFADEKEEKKKATKKETKKDSMKSSDKLAKNSVKLPCKVYMYMHDTITLTKELLESESDTLTNVEVESFLKDNFKIANALDFSYEANTVYGTVSSPSSDDKITIEESDVFIFNSEEVTLSDMEGTISKEDLKKALHEHLGELYLGESDLIKKGHIILPVFKEVKDSDATSKLFGNVTISLYGYKDITFSSEGKITVSALKKAVENEYPDLKNRISIVNLDGVSNSVGAVICSNTPLPAAKTNDVYKIDENTEIKFFSNTLPKIPAGEYSHNNLCKELAKVGVVECNTPNAIIIKEITKQNLFILGLKFGGSKGAY
jgi:hypothetical protein